MTERHDLAWPSAEAHPAWRHASFEDEAMGGGFGVHVAIASSDTSDGDAATQAALRDAAALPARVRTWASRLTRHHPESDLMRLNRDSRSAAPVRPTLARALDWAAEAGSMTDGIVDVTLLDARLAAEDVVGAGGNLGQVVRATAGRPPADRAWSLEPDRRNRHRSVRRNPGVRFDLDGVGKGWLADRALGLLWRSPGAIVDADGDIAIKVAPGDAWLLGVADPREPGADLMTIRLGAPVDTPARTFGLATSGTSVHHWGAAHHLIDPRTGRPAVTDVVQATVLAADARTAEALAKAAVILGAAAGLAFLAGAGALGAIVLTERDETLALPETLRYAA